jgi:hypothetical protein
MGTLGRWELADFVSAAKQHETMPHPAGKSIVVNCHLVRRREGHAIRDQRFQRTEAIPTKETDWPSRLVHRSVFHAESGNVGRLG